MVIHKYKPTSPGRRGTTTIKNPILHKGGPEKSLLVTLRRASGRNNRGRITSRRRGGGHKRQYRLIDFRRRYDDVPAVVASVEYDPYRTANVALLHYENGRKSYILAPKGLVAGDRVVSGEQCEPTVGNCMPLSSIPLGMDLHCVELVPGEGGKLARSAGATLRLGARDGTSATVIMPSGETRRLHVHCRATIGRVGNLDHSLVKIGKAGRNRWKGRRPKVRGSAMYPAAHPLGGGEGRASPGRQPVSPWGKLAKGGKTRNPRKTSNRLIIRGRKKK